MQFVRGDWFVVRVQASVFDHRAALDGPFPPSSALTETRT